MLEAGQVVNDRYELEAPIGEGAMAAVWRAQDRTLRRQVAIKFLFVSGTKDPQAMVDQFLREARIAASVQHRNVIHTVDFGTIDDQQPYMVMELLSGESLGERMDREPPLNQDQLLHLMSLTLRGLGAVHDAGIVHRDLKPDNIFLQRDADAIYPKILDFGISRSLGQGEDRPSAIKTQVGLIVGTPDYMSPEQARGEADIDRRADIYSMGSILYEGITGRLPYEADTIGDLIVKIVTTDPPPMIEVLPSVHPALSQMVAQAMQRDREQRFADARAMRRAMLAAAEQAKTAAPPTQVAVPVAAPPPPSPQPAIPPGVDLTSTTTASAGSGWGDIDVGPRPSTESDGGAAPLDLADPLPKGDKKPRKGKRPRRDRMAAQQPGPPRQPGAPHSMPSPGDPFDPLSGGGAQGVALDLDYSTAASRHPAARSRQMKQQRPPRARRAAPTHQHKRSKAWIVPAVLVLVMLAIVASLDLATSSAGIPASGIDDGARTRVTARRPHPNQAPEHMRDVLF